MITPYLLFTFSLDLLQDNNPIPKMNNDSILIVEISVLLKRWLTFFILKIFSSEHFTLIYQTPNWLKNPNENYLTVNMYNNV